MYQVIVDGIPWVDPDGHDAWALWDANALADHVASLGYQDVDVIPA